MRGQNVFVATRGYLLVTALHFFLLENYRERAIRLQVYALFFGVHVQKERMNEGLCICICSKIYVYKARSAGTRVGCLAFYVPVI